MRHQTKNVVKSGSFEWQNLKCLNFTYYANMNFLSMCWLFQLVIALLELLLLIETHKIGYFHICMERIALLFHVLNLPPKGTAFDTRVMPRVSDNRKNLTWPLFPVECVVCIEAVYLLTHSWDNCKNVTQSTRLVVKSTNSFTVSSYTIWYW